MTDYGVQTVCNICACVSDGWSAEELGIDITANEVASGFVVSWIDSVPVFSHCYFCEEMAECFDFSVYSR